MHHALQSNHGHLQMNENKVDFDLMQQMAEQGDAHAQTLIAISYAKGEGVPIDNQQASFWYQKASEQGYAPAQHNLGIMLEFCISQDERQAMYWYQKAASQGYAPAQHSLGMIYESSNPSDEIQAAIWYQKAAVQGYAPAQYFLSELYADGRGVQQNNVVAKEWADKAIEQGYDFFVFPEDN